MKDLKPCTQDIIKLIIHRNKKDIVTCDNRNLAYGLMKLRGGNMLQRPIPVKPSIKDYETNAFRKRKR